MPEYLTIRGIHPGACTRCSACIKDCPQQLFHFDTDDTVRFLDPEDQCIRCGHCIAVCPADAVDFSSKEPVFSHPKIPKPHKLIDKSALYAFFRARRSVRQYQNKPIDESALQRILEAMRHAPSASNRERMTYTVITDRMLLDEIKDKVLSIFRLIKLILSVMRFLMPFIRKSRGFAGNGMYRSLVDTLKRSSGGYDPVLFKAPCCIVVSSPKYGNQSGVDAGIALTHGMFAAQAEGLGTCLIGFAHEMLVRNRRFCKKLGVQKKNRVQGVMVIGHPAVMYHNAPPRKPLSAIYRK